MGSARFRAILHANITTHSQDPVLLEWLCLADAGPEADILLERILQTPLGG